MHRSKLLIWFAGVLIASSVVAGWIAIGRLAAATQRGMARTEQSLGSARDLAVDTAASAGELHRVIGLISQGLGSTGDALVATRKVSASVRGLLDIGTIFNRVENISDSLTEAEASIAVVEIDLDEASGSIDEATPVLDKAVVSLQAIPDQLDRSIAALKSSQARVGQQVWLWRLAISTGGAALLVMLGLITRLGAAVGATPSAISSAEPVHPGRQPS